MIFHDLSTFWKALGIKSALLGQNSVSWAKSAQIAYFTELNLQICIYTQKRRICREIANTCLTKTFVAIFALAERLPTSATLIVTIIIFTLSLTGRPAG